VYLDTSYIAKFYFNEPESPRVRELVRTPIRSILGVALAEFHGVIHRRLREGSCLHRRRALSSRFYEHVQEACGSSYISEALLRRTSALVLSAPPGLFIRTADAVHLTTAQEAGERDLWTSDRHMLASAAHFGLTAGLFSASGRCKAWHTRARLRGGRVRTLRIIRSPERCRARRRS